MRARVAIALLTVCATLSLAAAASATTGPYVAKLKDTVTDTAATVNGIEQRTGIHTTSRYGSALQGFAAVMTDAQVSQVRAEPTVEYVVRDATFSGAGWTSIAGGETVPVGIRRVEAAKPPQIRTPADSTIAVLDTGVDLANSDLNVISGTNCIKPGTAAQDDNGHGTNVAGIIAARNTGAGVVGVSPGSRIVSVKVLDYRNSGTLSQILCGIDWVTANAATYNIRVANMSLSGAGANDNNCGNTNSDPYHRAICKSVAAGVNYVAAAGNAKSSFSKTAPATYPEVLTVTAMSDNDGLPGAGGTWTNCKSAEKDDFYASYSNFAATTSSIDMGHTIAAPGTCVTSTGRGGGLSTYTGSSQAAPHVAGAVALCLGSGGAAGPCAGLSPSAVIAKMRSDAAARASTRGFSGDPLRPVSGKYFGHLLDASAGG